MSRPTRQPAEDNWAIATPHALASEVAANVLASGGNAVDAALMAAATLTVVYPNQCSVGGDVIALVGTRDGRAHCVNGSGEAASATDLESVARQHTSMPVTGALPVTVPGALDAWRTMADRWGTRPLRDALEGARSIASAGVPVAPGLARDLALEAERLASDAGAREVFFADGQPLREGDRLTQPALAETLRRLRDDGVSSFYDGPIGANVLATLQVNGSSLSAADLRDHRTLVVSPVEATYRGHDYVSAPPNSQGAYFLSGLLVLEQLEARLGRKLDPLGTDAGLVARVLSTLAWQRDRTLGDPADCDDLVSSLLSPERSADLAARALLSRTGVGEALAPAPAEQAGPRSGDTVAIVAKDSHGGWVSLIQSTFHAFGSGILDPATGIVLHNRGASFSLDPASPNRLGPGRRPLHTLMPVLVRRQGQLVGAYGTMGGRAQPQVHTQVSMHVENGMDAEQAIAMPRWILGSMEAGVDGPAPSRTVKAERGVPDAALQSLQEAGFDTSELPEHDDGAGHFQLARQAPGQVMCASDPRADGRALVG